jgi:hypothetical protein
MDDSQQNQSTNPGIPNTPQPPTPPPGQATQSAPQGPPGVDPQQQPQQQPAPQLVDVPTPPKSKPGRKILIISIGFLVLSALIVGGYYLFTLFTKDDTQKMPSTPSPAQTMTSTPVPTVDPTANWKVYENTKFGFSFKHSNDWTHNIGIGNNIAIAETEWSVLEGPFEDVSEATSGAVRNQITINSEESKLLFKDYLNETGDLFETIDEEKAYEANGLEGYLFKGLLNESVEGVITPTPAVIVILSKDETYVKFKLKRINPEDNTIDSFTSSYLYEILTTFQFTQ